MVFSSSVFLFLFLPLVLLGYALTPRVLKNTFLLLASLFFYAWGETFFVLVMLTSIVINYLLGLGVDRWRSVPLGKVMLVLAVAANLSLLVAFKYANFLVDSLNPLLVYFGATPIALAPVHLPIGISFFTFQALTYVVDTYRGHARVQRNPVNVATYIALFPQLIAGPIVRYEDIARELKSRQVSWADFATGAARFTVGLGKKMLIANTVAVPVDRIFALPSDELTMGLAWLGVLFYALQIYFDFSGYSDMAIGLGRMFGFHFHENFNYPYIAKSMREFWQRWHISLSTWFRDYLYIPLGGSRRKVGRVYFNLVVVFFLCGLWHGASWNFVAWGLFHGLFLVIERAWPQRMRFSCPRPMKHAYVLLAVMVSWVMFRADTLGYAWAYLQTMFGLGADTVPGLATPQVWDVELFLVLLAGVVGSTPVFPRVKAWYFEQEGKTAIEMLGGGVALVSCLAILWVAAMKLAVGTYNPFIYFRF
jgi:alginate O-acetyltransferase complex protein AlgI